MVDSLSQCLDQSRQWTSPCSAIHFDPVIAPLSITKLSFLLIWVFKKFFQTGEYFILSLIMFAASMIFVALSYFYYEYVPESAFTKQNGDKNDNGVDNKAYSPEIAVKGDRKFSKASLGDSAIDSEIPEYSIRPNSDFEGQRTGKM